MQVTITARHMSLTEKTQEDFKAKIETLERYDHKIQYVDVVCQKEHDQAVMEWKIGIEHSKSQVFKTEGADLKVCVDILMDKAEISLSRNKEQRTQKDHTRLAEAL
jgi:ribosomal subunit interface protein